MATVEHPITRAELREELRHYASKEDLANMETRLVKWMVGMMFAAVALASSFGLLVERFID